MPFARKSKNVFVSNKNQTKQAGQQGFPDLPPFFTEEPLGKDQNYPIERGGAPDFTCQRFIPFFSDQCSDIVGNSEALCEGDYLKCDSNPYKKNGEEAIISYHCGTTSDGQPGNQRIPIPAICKPISGTNPELEGGDTTALPADTPVPAPTADTPPADAPAPAPAPAPAADTPAPAPPTSEEAAPPAPAPDPAPAPVTEPEVAETDEDTDSDIEMESTSESIENTSNLNVAIPLDNGQKLRLIIE